MAAFWYSRHRVDDYSPRDQDRFWRLHLGGLYFAWFRRFGRQQQLNHRFNLCQATWETTATISPHLTSSHLNWVAVKRHKHDKLTPCCHAFTLALARLSCLAWSQHIFTILSSQVSNYIQQNFVRVVSGEADLWLEGGEGIVPPWRPFRTAPVRERRPPPFHLIWPYLIWTEWLWSDSVRRGCDQSEQLLLDNDLSSPCH